jgi:hypothetical protein
VALMLRSLAVRIVPRCTRLATPSISTSLAITRCARAVFAAAYRSRCCRNRSTSADTAERPTPFAVISINMSAVSTRSATRTVLLNALLSSLTRWSEPAQAPGTPTSFTVKYVKVAYLCACSPIRSPAFSDIGAQFLVQGPEFGQQDLEASFTATLSWLSLSRLR